MIFSGRRTDMARQRDFIAKFRFRIIFFAVIAVWGLFSGIAGLVKKPVSIDEAMTEGFHDGQVVEWTPVMGIWRRMTESKGYPKSYYFAVAATGESVKDLLIVRAPANFGKNFDQENYRNITGVKVKGTVRPMDVGLRTTLSKAAAMTFQKGYSMGDGYYIDTLSTQRSFFRTISGALALMTIALLIFLVYRVSVSDKGRILIIAADIASAVMLFVCVWLLYFSAYIG